MKILILIFGITLLGCSWTSKPEKPLNFSNDSLIKIVEEQKIDFTKQNVDSILSFDQLKIGQKTLYTGSGKTQNGETKTNGIYIKKISNTKIEYSYSQLINWKKEFDKKGKADLIGVSDSITTIKELRESTYKFMDSENDIVIFVTKNDRINVTKSKVFNKAGQPISELMYNK